MHTETAITNSPRIIIQNSSRYRVVDGQVFGDLTTVGVSGNRSGSVLWSCLCKCGRTAKIEGRLLLNKRRTCCRPCTAARREFAKINSKIGRTFGHWTVIGVSGKESNRTILYQCQCTCGNLETKRITSLASGRSKQCKDCSFADLSKRRTGIVKVTNEWRIEALARGRINRYRKGAAERGLEWSLSGDACMALFANGCYYCGAVPANQAADRARSIAFTYSGIDRRDNARGYVPDNVVSCCGTCNRAKSDRNEADFIDHAKRIAELHAARPSRLEGQN